MSERRLRGPFGEASAEPGSNAGEEGPVDKGNGPLACSSFEPAMRLRQELLSANCTGLFAKMEAVATMEASPSISEEKAEPAPAAALKSETSATVEAHKEVEKIGRLKELELGLLRQELRRPGDSRASAEVEVRERQGGGLAAVVPLAIEPLAMELPLVRSAVCPASRTELWKLTDKNELCRLSEAPLDSPCVSL